LANAESGRLPPLLFTKKEGSRDARKSSTRAKTLRDDRTLLLAAACCCFLLLAAACCCLLLQVALQLTAFSRANRPKCVVFCAECGENLASSSG
jgi:hypothetical protein